MTLKRWKFSLLAKQKEPLYVPVLLILKFAPRSALVCDKRYQATALEGSSYTASACLLNFWLSPGLQDPLAHLLRLWGFSVHRREFFSCESLHCNECFTVISQTRLSCFAPGGPCKGWGTADTKVPVENHHVYLSSLCACVKSFFHKTETYFNATFVMSCICIGDIINNLPIFFLKFQNLH